MKKFDLRYKIEQQFEELEENLEVIASRVGGLYGQISTIRYLNYLMRDVYYKEKTEK